MTAQGHREIHPELRPRTLLAAYASGAFPMPDGDDPSRMLWFSPDPRGLLPLDERFHVSRRLARTIRSGRFVCTVDRDLGAVMRGCARRSKGTWISDDFLAAYALLGELGLAHSVEAWPAGGPQAGEAPVGGVYGVALAGAFFAESMVHTTRDAGKAALVHLVERLRRRGMRLLDVQWLTPHLRTFGAIEVPRCEYLLMLAEALASGANFSEPGRGVDRSGHREPPGRAARPG